MVLRSCSMVRIVCLSVVLVLAGRAAGQASPAELLPQDAAITVVVPNAAEQLDELRQFLSVRRFYESPAWDALQKNPGWAQARIGLIGLAGAADMEPWEALRSVLGSDLAIALVSDGPGKPPRMLAVSRIEDAGTLDRFLEQLDLAVNVQPDSIEHVGDGRLVVVNAELSYGRMESFLLVGNNRELVREAMMREATAMDMPSRHAAPAQEGIQRATLHMNLDALRTAGGPLATSEPLDNPLNGYVFGAWVQAMRHGNALDATLGEVSGELRLDVALETDETFQPPFDSLTGAARSASPWRVEDLKEALGEIRVDRDWARLFADREQILTLEAANGVANFSAGVTTLMGGLDFMDQLLPRVNGPVRLVAARQDFSDMPRPPSPKIPAMALVIPLDIEEDEMLKERLYAGALGALTLIGLDQGQKQQPQLLANRGEYQEIPVVYARYVAPMPAEQHTPEAGDVAPIQYNFEPAVAVVEGELIVATTLDLLHNIIDLRAAGDAAPENPNADVLWLDSAMVEAALRDNTEELIMNRMLEQNESREQATALFEGIFQSLRFIEDVRLISTRTDAGLAASLRVMLAPVESSDQ